MPLWFNPFMNAVKCPSCGNLNALGENFCLQCGAGLPSSAQVSLSPEQHARAFGMNPGAMFVDAERGRRVFFWYRVYAGLMAAMYAMLVALGVFMIVFGSQSNDKDAAGAVFGGAFYAILGGGFFLIFAVALFLPRKPWTWIYHIVLICIGMTSCCLLPFSIPLLINWLKPETKAFFGRN
ncbi:MAG TPA: zinc ribbon domain-containing protein [Pyrinomonadaceae bacterium]